MHRTLKQETASPPAVTARAQQRAFDRFRRDYNELRPHEALAMQIACRRLPELATRLSGSDAGTGIRCGLQGTSCGNSKVNFCWKSERVFLGTVFEGERVGLLPRDDRYYTIYFGQFPIVRLDSRELKIVPLSKDKFFSR